MEDISADDKITVCPYEAAAFPRQIQASAFDKELPSERAYLTLSPPVSRSTLVSGSFKFNTDILSTTVALIMSQTATGRVSNRERHNAAVARFKARALEEIQRLNTYLLSTEAQFKHIDEELVRFDKLKKYVNDKGEVQELQPKWNSYCRVRDPRFPVITRILP